MGQTSRPASSWDLLQSRLGGSFTAHTSGLLAPELDLLDPNGESFGRLSPETGPGVTLRLGEYTATFEALEGRFRLISEGEAILSSSPEGRSLDKLEIFCNGHAYAARISFLRNRAVARTPGGGEVARILGSFVGRSYEARFDARDPCGLPVAIFLLWHTATNRRRAYRTGGGAM